MPETNTGNTLTGYWQFASLSDGPAPPRRYKCFILRKNTPCPYAATHLPQPPTRAVDALPTTVLEFGTPWCPIALRAQPFIEHALKRPGETAHIKVEDGPGQQLGQLKGQLSPRWWFLKNGRK